MSRDFSLVVERDEDGFYVASVPARTGCHGQARSRDELMERIREAMALHIEDRADHPLPPLAAAASDTQWER